MSKVYLIDQSGTTSNLHRIRCKNEEQELQQLLEKNPHLLPSDQISPSDPPRWLLIKREMPVVDPATGSDRWSIDFLYVDHMAIPTLVECKRCDDTRSRREVISQMLEYAANGHQYWSSEELLAHAQDAAGGLEPLNRWIKENNGAADVTQFFEAVVSNLRRATMRLVFFLEESPNELRSLVEFLNGQLKETEVLLVEARMYDTPAGRVVSPWLFGYTEQARVAKRESRAQLSRATKIYGENAYFETLNTSSTSEDTIQSVTRFINFFSESHSETTSWVYRATAILLLPTLLPNRGLLSIGRNGELNLYLGYWSAELYSDVKNRQSSAILQFVDGLRIILQRNFTDIDLQKYPTIKANDWLPHADAIRDLIVEVSTM